MENWNVIGQLISQENPQKPLFFSRGESWVNLGSLKFLPILAVSCRWKVVGRGFVVVTQSPWVLNVSMDKKMYSAYIYIYIFYIAH